MIELTGGDWRATLLPAQGAAFAALTWRGQEVLAPLPPGADPNASFAGAFVMAPWCNRLDGGRFGTLATLPINRPAEGTAIHGLSRDRGFEVATLGRDHVVLTQRVTAPPFDYALRLEVRLGEALHLAMALRNLAPGPVPMGLGWHPWFRCPAGARLSLPAAGALLSDERKLPCGWIPGRGIAAAVEVLAGMDSHLTGWGGTAVLASAEARLTLAAEGAWARNAQLFVPRGAGVLCVEPVSHIPDAPNQPHFQRHGPMPPLAPGAVLEASLRLDCEG